MFMILKHTAKLNVLALGALAVTLCLFYLMQMLIRGQEAVLAPGPPALIANITIPDIVVTPRRDTPKPDEPDPPQEVPPLERLRTFDQGPAWAPEQVVAPPVTGPPRQVAGPQLAEGNALALVKVPPTYPTRALENGIEGYVVLEFDVNENGQAVDARVLYSEPSGVFDRAALRALERWRYKPKVVDGRVVRMIGVQQKMSFSIAP